jgi:hypothetical protein
VILILVFIIPVLFASNQKKQTAQTETK